ncbi:MAG: hypothetical protein ACT4PZ_23715 [Panacagrimonas sp.]
MPARFRLLLVCALTPLLATGCASLTTPKRPEVPQGESCLALYKQVDAQIQAAGVQDAGYSRIPGFPYLRSDRFSASFANEIPDMDAFWEWVGYLRANEDEARDVELFNLNMESEKRSSLLLDLRACGAWLRSWELDDEVWRKRLIAAVQPPADYSTTARALGLYPLAVPFLNRGLASFRREVEAEYARPLAQLDAPGELVLWKAKPAKEPNSEDFYADQTVDLTRKPRDRLGRIGMLWSEVNQMAQFHAPALWIESAGEYDRPGAPLAGRDKPGVDVENPVVYFRTGFNRFGGQNYLQISYFVWFSERTEERPGDPAAGPLDGLIWRVTLDHKGQPMMYDTIHACGCYHYGFPVQAFERREHADTILFPQAEVPTDRVALRLKSGTHAVRRVVSREQAVAASLKVYELKPYEDLLTLPADEGKRTQSLFGPDGIVAGTERRERYWLWPSGVRNAGAMRQWGRHATAFVGQAHFDDPFLFETVLVPPALPGTVGTGNGGTEGVSR